jgi:hypothetical protein
VIRAHSRRLAQRHPFADRERARQVHSLELLGHSLNDSLSSSVICARCDWHSVRPQTSRATRRSGGWQNCHRRMRASAVALSLIRTHRATGTSPAHVSSVEWIVDVPAAARATEARVRHTSSVGAPVADHTISMIVSMDQQLGKLLAELYSLPLEPDVSGPG